MKIIFSDSVSPTFNLATEEFFFSKTQDELLFLYVNKPCVIIGRNQVVENEADTDFCKENNVAIIKRISGGGAVYHDEGNLNYCFISNRNNNKSVLSSDFLFPIVEVLQSLSVTVEIGKRKDLWIEGYKISGTASHVSKGRELHHGTLLYDTDLDKLQKALSPKNINTTVKAVKSVRSPVKNIRTFLQEHYSSTPPSQIFFQKIAEEIGKLLEVKEFALLSIN